MAAVALLATGFSDQLSASAQRVIILLIVAGKDLTAALFDFIDAQVMYLRSTKEWDRVKKHINDNSDGSYDKRKLQSWTSLPSQNPRFLTNKQKQVLVEMSQDLSRLPRRFYYTEIVS